MMRKRPLITLAITLLGVLGIAVLFVHARSPKPNVTLTTSPSIATAKLSTGKQIKQGSLYLKPSNYNLTISFAGFTTKTTSFTVNSSGTSKITVVLIPSDASGYQWLKDHPSEQGVREQIGSTQFRQNSQARQQKSPIVKLLPHIERYFRIDYGTSQIHPNDDSAVAIYITLYASQGKQQALDWIQQKGFDSNALELIYVDQTQQSNLDT